MTDADIYSADDKSFRVLCSTDGQLFVGLFMDVTRGQIETDRGVFQWEKFDRLLNALPPGKNSLSVFRGKAGQAISKRAPATCSTIPTTTAANACVVEAPRAKR